MNFGKEITFAIATLGETLNPGPTLAVLLAACFIGRREAWGVAVGIFLANCVWLALSVMVGAAILTNQIAVQIFTILGATSLVYLATRGLINNTLSFFFSGPTSADIQTRVVSPPRFGLGLQQGFSAHLMNPLSFTYYSGLYATTALNEPGRIWLFGLIAVASDLLVYGIIASLPVSKSNIPNLLRRLVGLIASFALLALVARVFSRPLHVGYPLLVGLTTLFMLIGFLVGALIEAERLVATRATQSNQKLWRTVAVWQSILGAIAISGTFLTVVAALDTMNRVFSPEQEGALRICALVAAIATVTLAYAKARGELQDLKSAPAATPASAVNTGTTPPESWWERPACIWAFALLSLLLLFLFFKEVGFLAQPLSASAA